MNARTEILKLKVRLKRTEEERDILKKAVCYFAREPDLKYRFINDHRDVWSITVMCRVLKVAHAGFYVWFHCPVFVGSTDNQRLLKLFRNYYALSGSVYCDLHDCDTYILGHHFFPHVCGTSETRTSTPSLAFQ